MNRHFNTAGPVNSLLHYSLDPLVRVDIDSLLPLIHQQKYFIIHAPRQTGKTSSLLALMAYLNQQGFYHALYVNFEVGQSARGNVSQGIFAVLQQIVDRAEEHLKDSFPKNQIQRNWYENAGPHNALNRFLTQWCRQLKQPLILLIDEIDSLIGDTLIAVLRQLRAGYDMRPQSFPQSVVLCGVRDVRDYRIHSEELNQIISGGSCFNIKAESIRLGDFTKTEIRELYEQHTQETGQRFEEEIYPQVWDYTEGQPWLVNALADQACFRDKEGKDRSQPITTESMERAKEHLILRKETHIDQLTDKLREPRVQRVIGPILQGGSFQKDALDDDLQYLIDLGLLRRTQSGPMIANRIYQEVIPRVLTSMVQESLGPILQPQWYQKKDGTIDATRLLKDFQHFFRENSESWIERFDYKEAGPQLLMQAFLQRIINGGGRVNREYALGRGRTDLLVIWHHPQGVQRIVIECKVIHKGRKATIEEGLEQTRKYMDQSNATEGHLVIFDRDPKKPWKDKIFHETQAVPNHPIQIWGM